LLETDADCDLRSCTNESVAMDQVLLSGADLNRNDVAGDLGCERYFAGVLYGAVLGHEDAATAGDAPDDAEKASASAHLCVRGHLDGCAHPGELAALRENALVGIELHVEHGHGGALNPRLHGDLLSRTVYPVGAEFPRI